MAGSQRRTARDEAVARFVERFGASFREAGVPPMAARAFAYILAVDSDRVSARELADGLDASPAAVSGAVKYLIETGLLERVTGSGGDRQHYYRVFSGDIWATILQRRLPLVERWYESMQEGIDDLGGVRRAGSALYESELYFAFMTQEAPRMLERWHAYRDRRLAEESGGGGPEPSEVTEE
ncbi:DNA-binding transcriptional regulator GbsR (MarR family) [Mumia flava]|uniref:DNA-binding transcriptional regulator GbsR (MarR family) n=1 Tax=Mumia flava TaxID=1348852 RepID=A0A2M9BIC0_9ACTN|nr:MarR family transcriptional regulator [Mumia flava]PJJ57696.1 DNA-binding transcriptional regulator GbsR (MarR family) [Mumia flava]